MTSFWNPKVVDRMRRCILHFGTPKTGSTTIQRFLGEHEMPDSWDCVPWKAKGGYGSQRADGDNANAARERLWFSPHCIDPAEIRHPLFASLSV